MVPTLEYCAARFLDHWARSEKEHFRAMQNPGPESIRSALAYFRVSRGFSGIKSSETGRKVADCLKTHSQYVTSKTATKRVEDLASAFQGELGFDNLLSAASKLLWLRRRSPFIIYDSRAIRGLKSLGFPTKNGDYTEYYSTWQCAFEAHHREIDRAARTLPKFASFTAAAAMKKFELSKLTQADWFLERTFDQFLWIIGEPKKRTGHQRYDA